LGALRIMYIYDDSVRNKLHDLILENGISVLNDSDNLERLLSTIIDPSSREYTSIIYAIREGVVDDILVSKKLDTTSTLVPRLTSDHFDRSVLSIEAAQFAVESWAYALGVRSTSNTNPTVIQSPPSDIINGSLPKQSQPSFTQSTSFKLHQEHENNQPPGSSISLTDQYPRPINISKPLHNTGECPLCGNTKRMHKAMELYDQMVCPKCYYGFANRRQLAYFIDLMLLIILNILLGIILGIIEETNGYPKPDIDNMARVISWFLYVAFICKDCFYGQSIGKVLCGVKVINESTGQPGEIGASMMRNLILLVPLMPLVVGFQLPRGYRVGDGWAKTKVIWKKYADHPIFAIGQPS